MPLDLLKLISVVKAFKEKGGTFSQIKEKMGTGKKAPKPEEIKKALRELGKEGKVRGPFKSKSSDYYFDGSLPAPAGTTIESVADILDSLIRKAGTKLLAKTAMEKAAGSFGKKHIKDALRLLVSKSILLELKVGAHPKYLHRDETARFWPTGALPLRDPAPPAQPAVIEAPKPSPPLTPEEVLPIYDRLKREQRGIDTVLIYDLMVALQASKESLHQFIRSEMKAGRAFIHPSTTINIPNEAIDYGIYLEGDPDVQVTVVFREKK